MSTVTESPSTTSIAALPRLVLEKVTGRDLQGMFADQSVRVRNHNRLKSFHTAEDFQAMLELNPRDSMWFFIPRSVRRTLASQDILELQSSVVALIGFEHLQILIDPEAVDVYVRILGNDWQSWERVTLETELPVNIFQYLYYLDRYLFL